MGRIYSIKLRTTNTFSTTPNIKTNTKVLRYAYNIMTYVWQQQQRTKIKQNNFNNRNYDREKLYLQKYFRSSGITWAASGIHRQSTEPAANQHVLLKTRWNLTDVPDFNLRSFRRSCCLSIPPRTDGHTGQCSPEKIGRVSEVVGFGPLPVCGSHVTALMWRMTLRPGHETTSENGEKLIYVNGIWTNFVHFQ